MGGGESIKNDLKEEDYKLVLCRRSLEMEKGIFFILGKMCLI